MTVAWSSIPIRRASGANGSPPLPEARFVWLEAVDSTNAYAAAHLDHLPHGTFVVAQRQTAGRGRAGRAWHSPAGGNVYMTGVLKSFPEGLSRSIPGAVTLAMALATCELLEQRGVSAAIKWPNDVLVGGRKIAGVLAQAVYVGTEASSVIVGVGINVNMDRADLEAVDRPATSIACCLGHREDARAVARAVADRFLARLATLRPDALRQEVLGRMVGLGSAVRIDTPGGAVAGRAIGLAEDFRLAVRDDAGRIRLLASGDAERVGG